jgi:hypothetical protein
LAVKVGQLVGDLAADAVLDCMVNSTPSGIGTPVASCGFSKRFRKVSGCDRDDATS